MGMTLEMTVEEKIEGLAFHKLDIEKRDVIFKEIQETGNYAEKEEVFYTGKNYEMRDFIQTVAEDLSTKEDIKDGAMYFYIDDHNAENVMEKTKAEIDRRLKTEDIYHPDTFTGQLQCLAEFYQAVKKVQEEDGFLTKYLFVEVGW